MERQRPEGTNKPRDSRVSASWRRVPDVQLCPNFRASGGALRQWQANGAAKCSRAYGL